MKENIIGREAEKTILQDIYNSKKSEFVAICGRRRVGKTYLMKEFFENEIVFQTAGIAHENTAIQLKSFYIDLKDQGLPSNTNPPKDWFEAFSLLKELILRSEKSRKVIILDELPWMDTPRSRFIHALEHFWNAWVSSRHDIILIVCGSATSWMVDQLINNHGGLHNRITCNIFLRPFTLGECEQFLQWKGFSLSRYEIAECYMVFGGIPFYLDLLQPRLSLTQNIDQLLFSPSGSLYHEFSNLYAALFTNSADYENVIKALSNKKDGLTRTEIIGKTGLKSGNGLTTILKNLEYCGFIEKYPHYHGKRQDAYIYQLCDFFTLFYFHFLESKSPGWASIHGRARYYSWAGLTFERLVFAHIPQIKYHLGIYGVGTRQYSWRNVDEKGGSQIDMVIERNDQTINICEMKFTLKPFTITPEYERNLRNKVAQFVEVTKYRQSVCLTFITSYGLVKNAHSGIVNSVLTLDDLFVSIM